MCLLPLPHQPTPVIQAAMSSPKRSSWVTFRATDALSNPQRFQCCLDLGIQTCSPENSSAQPRLRLTGP